MIWKSGTFCDVPAPFFLPADASPWLLALDVSVCEIKNTPYAYAALLQENWKSLPLLSKEQTFRMIYIHQMSLLRVQFT